MARNRIANKNTDAASGTVTFEWANDAPAFTADCSKLPKDIQKQLMLHGLSQKLGDTYAGAESIDDAITSVTAAYEQLLAGEFKAVRSGSGAVRTTLLAEAIASLQKQPIEAVQETIKGLDEEQVKGLRAHPGIKAEMSKIKAKRDAEKAKAEGGDAPDLSKLFAA